ncbi:uncharacterized protein [Littorina saxatilis]|uniref:uncharacterized protein n=1 Tax=Littorina saxatilis TaxID=31220 RepID=UPI0038B5808C
MAGVLLLSCFLLAVAGVICVQSATQTVRRDAQQLTEEPLREKKSACKGDDGLGAVVAQLVSELSSLKVKQHGLESQLQSTKSELQSTKSELHASQAKMATQGEQLSLLASTVKQTPGEGAPLPPCESLKRQMS